MEISLRSARPESVRTGLLALQTTANPKDPLFARLDRATGGHLSRFLRRRGFKGGDGPVVYQVPPGALPQEYLLLSSPSSDRIRSWRALADATVLRARELRLRSVAVVTPAEVVEVVAETIELTGYQFAGIRSGRRHATVPRIVLVSTAGRAAATGLSRGRALGGAACTARDLVNLPADVVTPESLAAIAQRVARSQGLQIKVLNER